MDNNYKYDDGPTYYSAVELTLRITSLFIVVYNE